MAQTFLSQRACDPSKSSNTHAMARLGSKLTTTSTDESMDGSQAKSSGSTYFAG